MRIKVHSFAYHRNGVTGTGFDVVLFRQFRQKEMFIGIVFPDPGNVAVLCLTGEEGLDKRVIEFRRNSWRGDDFEDALRKAIKEN